MESDESDDPWKSIGIFLDKLKTYAFEGTPVAQLPTPALQPKEVEASRLDEMLIQQLRSRLGKRSWSNLKEHWNDCAQCVVEINQSKSEELLVQGRPENAISIIVANEKFCNVVGGHKAMHGLSFG